MDEKKIGKMRQDAHPEGTERYYKDPNKEDTIGVAGEIAFAKRYGLSIDERILPEGDGHIDFCIDFNGEKITFDIKTAIKAYNLLIKEWEIDKCADVLVLAQYSPETTEDENEGDVVFLGWASRKTMASQPKDVFSSLGIWNYYLHFSKLNSMERIDDFFKNNSFTQILD